jgi:hypothetical protein
MNDFNNIFLPYEKNSFFFPEEDIFSSYLNSEDVVKQNNSNMLFQEYKPNPISNDLIFNNSNNNNDRNKQTIEKNTMFTNLFKIPENSKMNIDNEKSIFMSFNTNMNSNSCSSQYPSKLSGSTAHDDNSTKSMTSGVKTELIQNKRDRVDTKTTNKGFTKFKANSKSCSSLSEKDSGFLIFKTTKVDRKLDEFSDERSDEEEITGLDPISIKLKKNRMAAKKSRQKRKVYIQNLEDRVKFLETELENQKKINEKQNRMDDLVEMVNNNLILDE